MFFNCLVSLVVVYRNSISLVILSSSNSSNFTPFNNSCKLKSACILPLMIISVSSGFSNYIQYETDILLEMNWEQHKNFLPTHFFYETNPFREIEPDTIMRIEIVLTNNFHS